MGWPEGLVGSPYKHLADVCSLEGAKESICKGSEIADPGTREPEGQAPLWPEPFVLYNLAVCTSKGPFCSEKRGTQVGSSGEVESMLLQLGCPPAT